MREYISQEVIETKMINNKVTCNKCGKSHVPNYAQDMQSVELKFGYESKFDNQKWNFDLCDDCILEIIKSFKYIPKECLAWING